MNKLHKQRLVKNSIKNRAVIDAFNVEERVVQLKISLVQAKQKQVNIKNQLSSLILQQQIDLEKEIVDTEKRIEQEESMLAASQTLMNTLNKKVAHGYLADQNAEQFKIIRQTTQGPRLIKANEMTQLNAGDLVYIRSSQPMN